MKIRHLAIYLVLMLVSLYISTAGAQTRKPLTNQDVVDMTRQALAPSIIVKAIEANQSDFDVSAQALLDLKNAGLDASVMNAMLSTQASKPSAPVAALHATSVPLDGTTAPDPSRRICSATRGCLISEGTEVPLKFASDLTSKPAVENDPVEFVLDDDVKVGQTVVVAKGAHARPSFLTLTVPE